MELPQSIDEVLVALDAIVDTSVRDNRPDAYFAYVYRRTTAAIKKAVESGYFEDNPRMQRFDVYFANLYIRAYHDYHSGKPVSAAWKTAFDASVMKLSLAQYITLGMNAHINLDLGITAAHMAGEKDLASLETDFKRVNEVLFSLTQEMQRGLGKVSPFMFLADWLGRNSDEKLINFSIEKARAFSWQTATGIWEAPPHEKQTVIAQTDKSVADIGKMLRNPGSKGLQLILWLIRSVESKDVAKIIHAMKQG